MNSAPIVICGAGIAGVACAYYLSKQQRNREIVLVDKLAPLSLTTSKSGENYRAYWPQPWMNNFVSQSIDLMEQLLREHPGAFAMKSSGYDFVSHHPERKIFHPALQSVHAGVTVLTDQDQIRLQKPYLDPAIRQVLTISRAGAVDVYALGSLMLKLARRQGVKFVQANVCDIKRTQGGFALRFGQDSLHAQQLILCAGPFTAELASYLDHELPVYSVAQRKFVIPDPLNIIPRDMPFTIYADKQNLRWAEEELELINSDGDYSYLLEEFPAGLHIKPQGRQHIKMGWAFNRRAEKPLWDLNTDKEFPGIVMRGATRFIPGLGNYLDDIPTPMVQFAGYYTRTEENLPLIGALEDNLLVVSALAGYGTMSACAAGHLCAAQMNQASLPDYAPYLAPQRYHDSALMQEIRSINTDGQL